MPCPSVYGESQYPIGTYLRTRFPVETRAFSEYTENANNRGFSTNIQLGTDCGLHLNIDFRKAVYAEDLRMNTQNWAT